MRDPKQVHVSISPLVLVILQQNKPLMYSAMLDD